MTRVRVETKGVKARRGKPQSGNKDRATDALSRKKKRAGGKRAAPRRRRENSLRSSRGVVKSDADALEQRDIWDDVLEQGNIWDDVLDPRDIWNDVLEQGNIWDESWLDMSPGYLG